MEDLRVGVVGVGNIGTAHAHALFNGLVRGAVLGAVCDVSEGRRAYCAERFPGTPIFPSFPALLEGGRLDAVVVAVPHRLHADMAEAAMQRGLHVLSEKPIDIAVSKAESVNRTARETGAVFGVMFNQRTNPLYRKARELVSGGGIGALKRTVWIVTNWYRTQSYYDSGGWRATWAGEGGGVLLNQAPHNLDLWQWICGMPSEVTAFCDEGKYHRIETEDDASLFVRYANGATGVFLTSTGELPGTNRLEIIGDGGKIVLEDRRLRYYRLPQSERDVCFSSPEASPADGALCSEETWQPSAFLTEEHVRIMQNFVGAIRTGEPLIAPGTDGILELSLSNAAYLSSWSGHTPVRLPLSAESQAAFDALLAERIRQSRGKTSAAKEGGRETYAERWRAGW